MRTSRLVLLAVAAFLVAAGVVAAVRLLPGEVPDPATAARTTLPGLTPATGEPTLPSLATVQPAPGTAVQAAGPFDDRVRLVDLAFDDDRVTGTVEVTSDVSELLELEALAGFYDADGALLGTARHVHHAEGAHGPSHDAGHTRDAGATPVPREEFSIPVPTELRDRAVAAAVGVPVLVNE